MLEKISSRYIPIKQGFRQLSVLIPANQSRYVTIHSNKTRIFWLWPLTMTMTAFTPNETVMVLVRVRHEAQTMMSSISLTQGLLWFPKGMEVVIGWQRRRQMAFTVRRLYLPPQFNRHCDAIPEGNLSRGKSRSNLFLYWKKIYFCEKNEKVGHGDGYQRISSLNDCCNKSKYMKIRLTTTIPLKQGLRLFLPLCLSFLF